MNILVKETDIVQRIRELGNQINEDYRNKKPVLVGVLKGAFIFLADLIRAIEIPVEIDFLQVASYNGTKKTKDVQFKNQLSVDIEDQDVIVVEDIIDTGQTMVQVIEKLKSYNPRSIAVCALLNKNKARTVNLPLTYIGFNIPRVFVIGYGLDYANKYRNLRDIGVLNDN